MKVNFNVLNQKSAPALYESSLANRPTAGYMGRLFIDTDIPSTGIYWDSGTAWYKIASASIAETQSLNDVCVIGNSTVTLGTYIFGQSTYGQKSGAAIPVEPNYALTIGRGDSVNDKSLYVAFNSILNGLVNVIGGNTASNPGLKVSGGWFTGGSATTTKPQLLVEPDSTTSTAWSTLGTGIGINAATGFTGRLFDFQINAVSKAVLLANGNLLIGTTTDSGYKLDVNGTARISSTAASVNTLSVVNPTSSSYLIYAQGFSGTSFYIDYYNRVYSPVLTATNANYSSSSLNYNGYASIGSSCRVGALTAINTPTWGVGNTLGMMGNIRFSTVAMNVIGAIYGSGDGSKYTNTATLLQIGINASDYLGDTTADLAFTTVALNQKYDITRSGSTLIGLDYNPTFVSNSGKHYAAIFRSGSVGIGTATPSNSAILDITSTTQGFLPPRMTTVQKTAITSPAAGLMVYDTTLNKLCVFTTAWETITSL